jgi:hypothetical protein
MEELLQGIRTSFGNLDMRDSIGLEQRERMGKNRTER